MNATAALKKEKAGVSSHIIIEKKPPLIVDIKKHKYLYLMLLPGIIYYIIFKYVPIGGLVIVFQNYNPLLGFFDSKWVGLDNFRKLFSDPAFFQLLRNTVILAVYNLLFYFPAPIIVSLLLNEVRKQRYKKSIQTMIYLPHFISWTVLVGIAYVFLSPQNGIINSLLAASGKETINFLAKEEWFRPLVLIEIIWKETGWGTIIYLAALSGVDEQLYEAATIDGAGRFKQLWHVTLPAIRATIITLFILRLGNFLDTGFEQIFLMLNSLTRDIGEVFDTYVYQKGLIDGKFSYSTTVGLFKSVIGYFLIISANRIAKFFDEEGIY